MADASIPDQITLEFYRSNGDVARLIDMGLEFLKANAIDPSRHNNPFRVGIEKRPSKAGNMYFEYSQNALPLPDGLNTFIKIEGTVIPMGSTRPSGKGYPTREGQTTILVGSTVYMVTAYLTEGKVGYYVKVHAHKKPSASKSMLKAQMAPKGGSIL
ncbi:MAG: hypothetical protein H0W83_08375 [Planctomycetes bacterium]|nr:hypothetical protein [Planctomycetota bacterium]